MAIINLRLQYVSYNPVAVAVTITPLLRGAWTPVSSSVNFTSASKSSRGGAGHFNDLFYRFGRGGFGVVGSIAVASANFQSVAYSLTSLVRKFFTASPVGSSVTHSPLLRGAWTPVSSSVNFTSASKSSRGGAGHFNDLFYRFGRGGFGMVGGIQYQDTVFTSSDLINTTQARSATGISRITASSTQPQLGVANIRNTTTQTQLGVSKITDTVQQDQLGVSRIYATVDRTQTGTSRITIRVTQDQTGISRITVRNLPTQLGVSNIYATTTKTQTGRSAIQNTTTQTQLGVAKITNVTLQTQSGVARVQVTVAVTMGGVSRFQRTVLQNQTGTTRIQLQRITDQTGDTRITATVAQNQLGIANIYATVNRDQLGVTAIQNQTDRLQTGVSRVQQTVVWDQLGISRLKHTRTHDQLGLSKIYSIVRQLQTGKTRIYDPQYLFAPLFDDRVIDDPDTHSGTMSFLSGDAQFEDWIVGHYRRSWAYGPPFTTRLAAAHKKESILAFDFQELDLFVEASMEEDITPESTTIDGGDAYTTDWISGTFQHQQATLSNKTSTQITQDAVENLHGNDSPPMNNTQIAGEILMQPDSKVRITQDAVEVLHQINVGWVQQATPEALANQISALRYAVIQQCAVEALQSIRARVRETQLALEALKGANPDPGVNSTQVAGEILRQRTEIDTTPSFVQQVAMEAMKNSTVIPVSVNHICLEMIFVVPPAGRINHMAHEVCRAAALTPLWINHQALELIRNAAVTPAVTNQMAVEMLVRPEYDPTVSSLVNNPKHFY